MVIAARKCQDTGGHAPLRQMGVRWPMRPRLLPREGFFDGQRALPPADPADRKAPSASVRSTRNARQECAMDDTRFDRMTRRLEPAVSRRRLGVALSAFGLGASLGNAPQTEARKGRKKKPRCPPPEKPRCPDAAAPHWCASADACVPACPTGTAFNASACRCDCVVRRSCCQCTNGNANFCRTDIDDPTSCAGACSGGGIPFMPALRKADMTGSCTPSGRCEVTCAPTTCGTTDACKGGSGNCPGDLQCFQPLEGGPTRCGRPTQSGSCGCASHQQCADGHGIGAFCVQITGDACTCGGASAFCATQA